MQSVRDAKKVVIQNIDGKKIYGKIFEEDEIEKAETIVNALKGMTIASAKELLKHVDEYLLSVVLS